MPDEAPTCSRCGCVLEGRDVYEGTCAACREEMVLGGKGPKRAAPARKPPRGAAPPPVATPVRMDEDTREMEPLGGQPPPPDPSPLAYTDTKPSEAVGSEAPPAERPDLPDASSSPPEPPSPQTADTAPSATPPSQQAPLAGEEEPALNILDMEEDAPPAAKPPEPARADEGASAAADQAPSAATGPRPNLSPAADPLPAPDQQEDTAKDDDEHFVFSLKLPAELRVADDEEEKEAEQQPEPEPPPPRRQSAATFAEVESPDDGPRILDETQPEPRAAIWVEPRERGEPRERETLRLAVDVPSEQTLASVREALERLERQMQALTGSVRHGPGGQTVGSGFRFCVGFVLALGVLGGLVVGGMYVIGRFVHPPTLELLQRILHAVSGS